MKTATGDPIVLFLHGGGILSTPGRMEKVFRPDGAGKTDGGRGAKLTDVEAQHLLAGKLPDGTTFPLYNYSHFLTVAEDGLPRRYGVTLPFDLAAASKNGYTTFTKLKEDPVMIVRAGGYMRATAYLDMFSNRHGTNKMGAWNVFERVDPSAWDFYPQTHVTKLAGNFGGVGSDGSGDQWGYNSDYGIGGDASITNRGRYIGALVVRSSSSSSSSSSLSSSSSSSSSCRALSLISQASLRSTRP